VIHPDLITVQEPCHRKVPEQVSLNDTQLAAVLVH